MSKRAYPEVQNFAIAVRKHTLSTGENRVIANILYEDAESALTDLIRRKDMMIDTLQRLVNKQNEGKPNV